MKYLYIALLSFSISHPSWAEETPAPAPAPTKQSQKGAWLAKSKSLFISNCASSNTKVDKEAMKIACTCVQKKVEPDYIPSDLQTPEGKKVLSSSLKTCIAENKANIMGVQGAWAKVVKKQWMKNCESSRPKQVTAEVMKKTCSCTLNLLELKYDPNNQNSPEATKFAEEKIVSCYQQNADQ